MMGAARWGIVTLMAVVAIAIGLFLTLPRHDMQAELTALGDFATQMSSAEEITAADIISFREQLANIENLRSQTSGPIFMLQAAGVFVAAIGGIFAYVFTQNRKTDAEERFKNWENTDSAIQKMIERLSNNDNAYMRLSAAVQFGDIIDDFPEEWRITPSTKKKLKQRIKRILAGGLALESDNIVLEKISTAIVMQDINDADDGPEIKARRKHLPRLRYDLDKIDLSKAKIRKGYWADVSAQYADFYQATLYETSLRRAFLQGAQFYDTKILGGTLADAYCEGANFINTQAVDADFRNACLRDARFASKPPGPHAANDTEARSQADFTRADFRGADLTGATFDNVILQGARVHGVTISKPVLSGDTPVTGDVDLSEAGDGSQMTPALEWLRSHIEEPDEAS